MLIKGETYSLVFCDAGKPKDDYFQVSMIEFRDDNYNVFHMKSGQIEIWREDTSGTKRVPYDSDVGTAYSVREFPKPGDGVRSVA